MKYYLKLRKAKNALDFYIDNAMFNERYFKPVAMVSGKIFKILKPIIPKDNIYRGFNVKKIR